MNKITIYFFFTFFIFQTTLYSYSSNPKVFINELVNDAITNNATLANNYQNVADERLREARFIDATENSLGTIESNEFTDARL